MNKNVSGKTEEQQAIEALQARFDELSHERTRIEARQEAAQKQLDELQEQSRQQFGTDDVAELEKKLASMQKENEEKRARYEASLDGIEGKLKEIENQFAPVDPEEADD
ncbi:MAG: hypothetical protein MK108_10930 [Mariniblastus sp.]|nr:hypothetical protein [Mariniblastus sp.]